MSACSAPETPSSTTGTTPSIWTGSPSPSASAAGESQGEAAPAGDKLTAQLKNAGGATVATADFAFSSGYATVTVKTTAPVS